MRKHSSSSILITLNKSYTNKTQYSTVPFGLPFPDEEDDAILWVPNLRLSCSSLLFTFISLLLNLSVQKGFLKYQQLQIITCKGNIVLKPVLWYCGLLFNFNHYVDLFFWQNPSASKEMKTTNATSTPIHLLFIF